MTVVIGIPDGFQELGITPGTADIFGWTTSGSFDQARIDDAWLRIDQALDLDRVLPAVTEVIKIFQGLCADIFEHVNEAGFGGIERPVAPVGIGNPPSNIFGANLLEVRVGPAHRRLDRKMQTVEPDRERHFDAADDERLDVIERDLEAMAAGLMPPVYDAPAPAPSATAAARQDRQFCDR
jgi:hypothetical protein